MRSLLAEIIRVEQRLKKSDSKSMAPITPEKINLKERMDNHQLNKLDGAPEIDDMAGQTNGLGGLAGAATGKGNKGTGAGGATGANALEAE